MKWFERIYARDVIAVILLLLAFTGKLVFGVDGSLNTLIALIAGYYFSKRVYEEKNREEN